MLLCGGERHSPPTTLVRGTKVRVQFTDRRIGGKIAESFGELLHLMWSPGASVVTPRGFKYHMGRFRPGTPPQAPASPPQYAF